MRYVCHNTMPTNPDGPDWIQLVLLVIPSNYSTILSHHTRWHSLEEHMVDFSESSSLQFWYHEITPDGPQCTQPTKHKSNFASKIAFILEVSAGGFKADRIDLPD